MAVPGMQKIGGKAASMGSGKHCRENRLLASRRWEARTGGEGQDRLRRVPFGPGRRRRPLGRSTLRKPAAVELKEGHESAELCRTEELKNSGEWLKTAQV